MGAIMRHGPHHVAQKSTIVSVSLFSTSCSKLASVTAITLSDISLPVRMHIEFMQESSPRGTTIAHIGIAVRGLDDSLPFYRDVLGLAPHPLDDADGARIVGLAAGPSLVELLETARPDTP